MQREILFEALYNGAHTSHFGIAGAEWTGVRGHRSLLSLTDRRNYSHEARVSYIHFLMACDVLRFAFPGFPPVLMSNTPVISRAKTDNQWDFVQIFHHPHPQQEKRDALQLHAWHDILLSVLRGDMGWTWNICAVKYWNLKDKPPSAHSSLLLWSGMWTITFNAQMWPWTTKPVISSMSIFAAIANNGSELSIFLLSQKSLGYQVKIMFHEDILYISYRKYMNLIFVQ